MSSTETSFYIVRYCSLENWNLDKILLGCLNTFGDSCCYFTSLAETPANNAIAVTDYDDCCECESATTLCYLCNTVNSNQPVFQFYVTIYFNFVHCLNRLKIQSAFACCISKRLYSTMIKITIAVENHRCNTSLKSLFSHKFADFLSLLDFWHSL